MFISCSEDSMLLLEESWNAYPHCVTVIVNGYLAKNKFFMCIESNHLPDNGNAANAVNMSSSELKNREVEVYVTQMNSLGLFKLDRLGITS